MKKLFLALALVLLSPLTLSAAEKTLVVATNPIWPPMEMVDMNKQIVGYDMDIIAAAAAQMGYKVQFLNTAWDGIFATLNSKQCDIIASCVTITEERKKNYLFSVPYYEVRQALMVPIQSEVKSLADLKGKSVGVQIGTTAVEALKRAGFEGTIKTYDEVGLVFEDLRNGRLDAAMCDDPVARHYASRKEGYENIMKLAFLTEENEEIGFVMRKDDTELAAQLNAAISEIRKNGAEKEIAVKWLGE